MTLGMIRGFIAVPVFSLLAQSLGSASEPPAEAGSPCTAFSQLRGSSVETPKDGDVATAAQLCLRGESVRRLQRVPFVAGDDAAIAETDLARDQSLHPSTSITAPDGTTIDLDSRNGNWTHLFSGAVWRAPAITTSGEIQALDRGHGLFSVAASLGYFAVVLPRFLARVRGTIFDIDFEPSSVAAFSVSEGTVAITRTVAIRLRNEKRLLDGVRFTDTITANGRRSILYRLPLTVEREFENERDAERAFTGQLREAIAGGDAQSIDDAINNVQIVKAAIAYRAADSPGIIGAATVPASDGGDFGRRSTSFLTGLVSAAVVGAGALAFTDAQRANQPQLPTPTPSPTVIPTPIVIATATPSPSPSPAPRPTPTPSPTPSASPTAALGTLTLSPSALSFDSAGANASQTSTASQVGYTGSFTSSGTSCNGIATIARLQTSGVFNVTPVNGGICSYTITGGGGMAATLGITVTITNGGIAERPKSHK